MDHKVSTQIRHDDDEIDLMELLMILTKEKRTIFITMGIVTALSLGGALLERNSSKTAEVILTPKLAQFKRQNFLVANVLEKVHTENDVRRKHDLTLDKFSEEFKIDGIIPKSFQDKKEFLAKTGETLTYDSESYKLSLRVGDIGESKKILTDYVDTLNEYYREQNESKYIFRDFSEEILNDERYNFEDYIKILESRKNSLKNLIAGRENTKLNYISYGFGYREIGIELQNLENIRIQDLKNYLLATNIVRDKAKFESEFSNRKFILENKIKEKKEEAQNYKTLVDNYKFENGEMIVPKGLKIAIGDNVREKYYTELTANYLNAENEGLILEEQLKELVYISQNLKTANDEEKNYIMDSLKNIIKDYNSIVARTNILEAKENYINSGELIQLASPIEIVSNSKAKLILAVGIVMGAFLGIMMAFLKTFYSNFKNIKNTKNKLMMFGMFIFLGLNTYSSEEFIIGFTHKEMKVGLNPDRTPFNLEKSLVQKYLLDSKKITKDEIKNISIEPLTLKGVLKNVEERLVAGEKGYQYVPTEYKVTIDLDDSKKEKALKNEIIKEFPAFYIDSFLERGEAKIESYSKHYQNYRDVMSALNNKINGLRAEIEQRKAISNTSNKEMFYEYNNLGIELNKISDVRYRDTVNYIRSNHLVKDLKLERIFLTGEKRYINLGLDSLMSKKKTYVKLLKNYSIGERSAQVLESGDLAMSVDTGVKEKQYIDISRQYVNNLNLENSYRIRLIENERNFKEMRLPNSEEIARIESEFKEIAAELN
ncbi:MAG: hypothetical protein ACRC4X_05645, partial [Cetobacterium sp.]